MKEAKTDKSKRPSRLEFIKRCDFMRDELTNRIVIGEFPTGAFLPSEHDLASYYTLSRESVRKVLRKLEENELVTRIKNKGVISGKYSSKNSSKTIAILAPHSLSTSKRGSAFLEKPDLRVQMIFETLDSEFSEEGIAIEILPSDLNSKDIIPLLNRMQSKNIKGLVILYRQDEVAMQLLKATRGYDITSIAVSSCFPESDIARVVCFNDLQIGVIAAEHLIGNGHEHIGFIGDLNYEWVQQRLTGFKETLINNGYNTLQTTTIFDTPVNPAIKMDIETQWYDAGFKIAASILKKEKITAIFCANDAIAAGVYEGMKKAGKKIPEELSIIGCDYDYSYRHLNITTIKVNCIKIGITTAKMLQERINGNQIDLWEKRVKTTPTLVEKNSVNIINNTLKSKKSIA